MGDTRSIFPFFVVLCDRIPSMHYVYDTIRIDLLTRRAEHPGGLFVIPMGDTRSIFPFFVVLCDRIPSMHYVYNTVRIDLSTRRTEHILADLRSVS